MSETDAEKEFRRVTACVRACEGIPTDLLEGAFIARLVGACLHVEDSRVRALLEELVASVESLKKPPIGATARTR